jgi:hypothetical protein
MKPEIRVKFFDTAWKNGILQILKIRKQRYKEYRQERKKRFRILPTLTLVKKICKLLSFDLVYILKNSELIPYYMFSISGRKNLIDFASKVGFSHPKKAKKLQEMLIEYRYNGVEYDKKILKCLDKQSMSTLDLAKVIRKPRYYTLYRLERLERLCKVIRIKTSRYDEKGRFIPYFWKILH